MALFVLSLDDEGDLPAWALACELAPDRAKKSMTDPSCTMLIGAAPLRDLARTLHRAGERELSAALASSSTAADTPVVLLDDVVRMVTGLRAFEDEEIESLLREGPPGSPERARAPSDVRLGKTSRSAGLRAALFARRTGASFTLARAGRPVSTAALHPAPRGLSPSGRREDSGSHGMS